MRSPTDPAATAAGPAGPPAFEAAAPLPIDYGADLRPAASRFRWVILALVFFAITINYVDRMVIGILAPELRERFHISSSAYGYITAAFGLSYAIGQAISGRWLDWIGTRVGYAIALLSWSFASMSHALARGALGFGICRSLLGFTESPAFPAATKTLAEWFPKKERALAMGFVNAGSNVGAVLAPIVVPWLALRYGWQWAFIATGAIGLLWLALWIPIYRRPHEHPRVSPAELAHINSDPPERPGKVRWATLLTFPQTWAFMTGKFLTDPVWSFYLFWLPTFLKDRYGVDLKHVGPPMITIYLMADIGSIGGGWLSSSLIHRGHSVNVARKTALLVCALLVLPSVSTSLLPGLWWSVLVAGLALAAHQGFSSNLYTLVSDMFPRRAVGSVAGLGGTAGYLGTTIFMAATGLIIERTGKYLPVFLICGSAYLLGLAIIHLLVPLLQPAVFEDDGTGAGQRGFEVTPK
jgi:ACS family hexuronate transporter-like MFS transporter